MMRVLLILILIVVQAGLAREPSGQGPFALVAHEFAVRDLDRNRTVEVLLLSPAGEGKAPFVLFSPGFLLSGRAYRGTGELLASHGIAVALLTYDMNLFTADQRLLADDLRFVLRALPSAAAARGVDPDPERIALAGHSLGGKLSFLVAPDEPTVRAVVGLDPVDGGASGIDDPARFPRAADRMEEITIPKLLIGAERGGKARFGIPCAPREFNYERLYERTTAAAWEATQLGAGHMDYLDNPDCGFPCSLCVPGTDPTQAREAAQAYLVLFFRAHLVGEVGAQDDLEARLEEDEAAGLVRVRRK